MAMKTVRTILCIATVAMFATPAPAASDFSLPTMPKKFQGVWFDAEDGNTCPLFINANSVSHCNRSDPLKLVKIEPGDEELNTVIVTWRSPHPVSKVYKLVKSGGRQGLIDVNAESPAVGIGLYWKKRD